MADISRAEVSTLIEENYSHALLNSAAASSSVLQAIPTISSAPRRHTCRCWRLCRWRTGRLRQRRNPPPM